MNKTSINFILKDYKKLNKENCFTIIENVQHFVQPSYILFLQQNKIDFLEPVEPCYYFSHNHFKLNYYLKKIKDNEKSLLINKNELLEKQPDKKYNNLIKLFDTTFYDTKLLKKIVNIIALNKNDTILVNEIVLDTIFKQQVLFLQNINNNDSAIVLGVDTIERK